MNPKLRKLALLASRIRVREELDEVRFRWGAHEVRTFDLMGEARIEIIDENRMAIYDGPAYTLQWE